MTFEGLEIRVLVYLRGIDLLGEERCEIHLSL
jgi:hypothetical protein